MTGSVETSLTLLLVALTLPSPSLSSFRRCGSVRPHPEGYCGDQLARLHRNFCFLLRMEYPDYFTMAKRSADPVNMRHHPRSISSLNIPLSTLASLDIPETKADAVNGDFKESPQEDSLTLTESFDVFGGSEVSDASYPGMLHILRKRSSRQKRDLVCECCYSACSRERLAMYC